MTFNQKQKQKLLNCEALDWQNVALNTLFTMKKDEILNYVFVELLQSNCVKSFSGSYAISGNKRTPFKIKLFLKQ